MQKCSLCGRKISNRRYCFGLGCLKKVCTMIGIERAKNLKHEARVNNEVQRVVGKKLLNKKQEQLLTNRYLTYLVLSQIEIPHYQNVANYTKEILDKIDNKTTESKLKKNKNYIPLKEAFEILKLYNRYKEMFDKTEKMTEEELRKEAQNLPWDTIMFAFSSYYEKKPYLSELIQVVQLFVWKIGVILSAPFLECGSEFLNYSLQEKPQDLHITEGKIIEKIKRDENFINKIEEIIEKT